MNTNIFTKMSYGVYAITTLAQGTPTGCIANSVMQITVSPATVAVSMNHSNYTNACMEKEGKFAINILSEQTPPAVIGTFGFQSGRDTDKFRGMSYEMKEGMPVLSDACGYVVCKVVNKMETETHTVFLGEVIDCNFLKENQDPMTYAYYHQVIKGKSPKTAPTYLQEEPETEAAEEKRPLKQYRCEVCGYIYEGEELPADYICPICGVGVDRFKPV